MLHSPTFIPDEPGFPKQPTVQADQTGFLHRPASSNISAIKRRHRPAQPSDNSKTTSRFALWHDVRDRGEDMKKWHKKPTPALQARVKELQDRSTTKVNFPKKVIVPVAVGHSNSHKNDRGNQ